MGDVVTVASPPVPVKTQVQLLRSDWSGTVCGMDLPDRSDDMTLCLVSAYYIHTTTTYTYIFMLRG
jgi:hypothetical protein